MTTLEFLQTLYQQHIQLWVDGDQLRCDAPKGTLTPALVEQLKSRKADLIALLRQTEAGLDQPIPPVPRDGVLPLSFAQQRLWFLDQMGSGSAYNIPLSLQLTGRLDRAALQQTLTEVVRRHASLRTTFETLGGEPCQIIDREGSVALPVQDLRYLSAADQKSEVARQSAADARDPFDLSRDRMLRAQLLWLEAEVHILLLTLHHIAFDGWSAEILVRELAVLYEAFSQGKPSPLPQLPIQYADFAVWQRHWLQGDVLERHLRYWTAQLAGAPALLQLPTDHPRPSVESFRGRAITFDVGAALMQQLQALSQQAGATLFMTLLAAFQVLMGRYSGQDDIVVGSPIANRTRQEIEPLIGFFVNTLALRVDLSSNPTFLELLAQVRQITQAAYEHQDVPFERLVEELPMERALNYNPVVQAVFALQRAPIHAFELPGLRVTPLPLALERVRFDLEIHLWERPDRLDGYCIYSTDLFEESTMTRLIGCFRTLLAAIVADPAQRIGALPLLSEAEQHQLVVAWNQTAIAYPQDTCVQQLFEAQVERTPDAVAVVFDDHTHSPSATYRTLNARANQLAHYLQSLGVGPDTLVGICMERSLEMVVGLLGILKAGGAYVPLDSAYPPDRLAFMLADTQVQVLLTQDTLWLNLPDHPAHVICLDTQWAAIAQHPTHNPTRQVASSHLAYVLYTSGSTGRPKGVAMPHEALCNLIQWQLEHTAVPQPRTLQFAPISFDVSFQEMFATWCAGGALYLVSEDARRDMEAIRRLIRTRQLERLFLPFIALHHLAEAAVQSAVYPSSLREVITAGEQLQVTPAIATLFEHLPTCTLANHYGPTEAHVVTTFVMPETVRHWPALPPIGRPLANAQIYILDRHHQPVPIGVLGELYIGGRPVARGYHQRPGLTSETFIPNPFGAGRLYKTGDQTRYLADGSIVFLGRLDQQVKIRGFRVELGEIEAALCEHPEVREAVVIDREEPPGEKRLVAYVLRQGAGGQPPEAPAACDLPLADFLRLKLPDYMVPSIFVQLEALPLTPSGKVDRRALPAPAPRPLADHFAPPQTPTQVTMAAIWREVLGLEQVGIHDNFFELGGHSLLATQTISRIRNTFGIELPLRTLFEHPTVAGLAEAMVDHETTPGQLADIAHLRQHLSQLSEEEIEALLRQKQSGQG